MSVSGHHDRDADAQDVRQALEWAAHANDRAWSPIEIEAQAAIGKSARLQFNPDPLKVVSVRRGEARGKVGFRCDHEDGRGRCTSRDTRAYLTTPGSNLPEMLCDRHASEPSS